MTTIHSTKKVFSKNGFLFTAGTFANLKDKQFVAVAKPTAILRYGTGAVYKINEGFGAGADLAPLEIAFGDPEYYFDAGHKHFKYWENEKAIISTNGWTYSNGSMAPPEFAKGPLDTINKLFNGGYMPLLATKQFPKKTGKAISKWKFEEFPEEIFKQPNWPTKKYKNRYRNGIMTKNPAGTIKDINSPTFRFSMAADILGMEPDKTKTYTSWVDRILKTQFTGNSYIYWFYISSKKAAYIDQITSDDYNGTSAPPVSIKAEQLPGKPAVPPINTKMAGYDGLKNVYLQQLATMCEAAREKFFVGKASNQVQAVVPVGFENDFNSLIKTDNAVSVELKNIAKFGEYLDEYEEAKKLGDKGEHRIISFYTSQLNPAKDYPKPTKSILYDFKVAPSTTTSTVVLEVADLLKAPKSAPGMAHITVTFTADFSTDLEYNKVNYLSSTAVNQAVTRKRLMFRRLLMDKLISPSSKTYYGQNLTNKGGASVIYNSAGANSITHGKIEVLSEGKEKDKWPEGLSGDWQYSSAAFDWLPDNAMPAYQNKLLYDYVLGGHRTFEDIVDGKLARNETIGYRITKSRSHGVSLHHVSSIYIVNAHSGPLKVPLTYVDTQIIPGVKYSYEVEQIVAVAGTKLSYSLMFGSTPFVDTTVGSYFTKGSDSFDEKLPIYRKVQMDTGPLKVEGYGTGKPSQAGQPSGARQFIIPKTAFKLPFSVVGKKETEVFLMPVGSVQQDIGDITKEKGPDIKETIVTPLTAPTITIYTYREINNKVTLKLESIAGEERKVASSQEIIKYEGKEIINKKDGTITFNSEGKKVAMFKIYRTTTPPTSYEDFPSTPHKIIEIGENTYNDEKKKWEFVSPSFAWVGDKIEPNTTYYYYAVGVDKSNLESKNSFVVKVEITDESGMIYGLVEAFSIEKAKEKEIKARKKTKRFKRLIRIKPSFLQAAPNPSGDNEYVGYLEEKHKIEQNVFALPKDVFGVPTTPSGNNIIPGFKFRIKSLKSRRKMDINVLFTRETKVVSLDKVPPTAEIVFQDNISTMPGGVIAEQLTEAAKKLKKEGYYEKKKKCTTVTMAKKLSWWEEAMEIDKCSGGKCFEVCQKSGKCPKTDFDACSPCVSQCLDMDVLVGDEHELKVLP